MAQPGLRRLLFAIGYGTTTNLFFYIIIGRPRDFFLLFQISDGRLTWSCMQRCGNIIYLIRYVLLEPNSFGCESLSMHGKHMVLVYMDTLNVMMDRDDMASERPVLTGAGCIELRAARAASLTT